MARSVIGKNAFDTEFIWQHGFMDGFYSPGKERLHALGAIDLALWDIKGKALNAPLYQLFGGKAREHIELYATNGVPPGLIPQADCRHEPEGSRRGDHGSRLSRVPRGSARFSRALAAGGPRVRGRRRRRRWRRRRPRRAGRSRPLGTGGSAAPSIRARAFAQIARSRRADPRRRRARTATG